MKKVILMILDGWGKSTNPDVSAIDQADTPFIDNLYKKYPNASIRTDGLNVGLPKGQMGNSEVGHINIGAGRIVFQDLVKINKAVEQKTLQKQKKLVEAFEYAKNNNKKVHFLGLLSDGGIHSHINHLKGLIDFSQEFGLKNVFIHAFTDGRDVDPKSGISFVEDILNYTKNTNTKLVSVIGRYYAMDRDKRWERIRLAYDLIVKGIGEEYSQNIIKSIENSYNKGITDEFIKPIVITDQKKLPIATISENDVVIFFNFRTDRGRELTEVLTQFDLPEHNMHKMNLHYLTMTNYDDTYKNINVIYDKDNLKNTLGEVLQNNNKTQIRIAETEKYPHVTFFFSGGREEVFKGEKRIMCPSPKVATYDLKPEMSAFEVKDALIPELRSQSADFVCLNFANGDMVGHSGNMQAAIKACEAIDKCVKEIVETALENKYTIIITADHGNCEMIINPDGSPNTAHSTNPVPIILIDNENKYKISDGILADIAPTILDIMQIEKPEIMNGKSLIF